MRAPILIGEIELTEPVTAIRPPARHDGAAYNGAYLLVRIQHIPVGYVFLPPDAFGAAAVERKVWQELKPAINEGRRSVGLPGLEELPAGGIPEEPLLADQVDLPFVSVVVCTRDRTDSVLDTLRDLAGIHYARFEVVLVDNAPSSDATREAVLREFGADPRIRYVRELRPGLSCARNRGLREATATSSPLRTMTSGSTRGGSVASPVASALRRTWCASRGLSLRLSLRTRHSSTFTCAKVGVLALTVGSMTWPRTGTRPRCTRTRLVLSVPGRTSRSREGFSRRSAGSTRPLAQVRRQQVART